MLDQVNRRAFFRAVAAAGAAWATADVLEVEDALAFAEQQVRAQADARTNVLTATEVETLTALCSRILPAVDGRPGAREAGAMYFIDRAVATFNAAQRPLYTEGLADLNRRVPGKFAGQADFAALTTAQQDDLIREIEDTPFFQTARVDTIAGTFALPSWGGNRDYLGWQLLGLEHRVSFQAPFGYYDAEIFGKNR